MKISLKKSYNLRIYEGKFVYLIIKNWFSGRKNVYDVYIQNVGDPITIGLEIDLKTVKGLICDCEILGPAFCTGSREQALSTFKKVKKKRNKC